MYRTFRYPLRPTRAQEALLEAWLAKTRDLYNMALQERRDARKRCRVSVTLRDQQKSVTQIRSEDAAFRDVSAVVLRGPLRLLDNSFKAFFRRVKTGQEPGYPRFKGRDRWKTLDFQDRFEVRDVLIQLEKIGAVKLHLYRPLRGKPLSCKVTKTGRGWIVSVACELPDVPKAPVTSACGIDLNLKDLVVTSNGETYVNPREGRRAESRLKLLQQELSRKKRGSNARRKCKAKLTRAHERVVHARLDAQRQLAAKLFGRYDLIAHEDLNIAQMIRKDGQSLQKSIHDAAWGGLIRALTLKAENAGKWLIPVDPAYTSKTCSSCGARRARLALRERKWTCSPQCAFAGALASLHHAAHTGGVGGAGGSAALMQEGFVVRRLWYTVNNFFAWLMHPRGRMPTGRVALYVSQSLHVSESIRCQSHQSLTQPARQVGTKTVSATQRVTSQPAVSTATTAAAPVTREVWVPSTPGSTSKPEA